jgi:crotonobetainyl-CoA:carnitine CoA-transferase CaiB-like acyl-CoA transferase
VPDPARLVAGNIPRPLLADLGGEAIEVERPGGDDLRNWKTGRVALELEVGPVCDEADLAEDAYVSEREVLIEVPEEAAGSLPRGAAPPGAGPGRAQSRDPARARRPRGGDRASARPACSARSRSHLIT